MDTECKVGSIREIQDRLVVEGYHVTEYALRKWIRDGVIPSVHSGKKYFITYDHVIEFLTTGSAAFHPATI